MYHIFLALARQDAFLFDEKETALGYTVYLYIIYFVYVDNA
jgi:hypothetical protein